MVRIISYNVHFGKRLEKILAWISKQSATDIICFQEFPEHRVADCMTTIQDGIYGYRFAPSLHRRKKVFGQLTIYKKNRVRFVSSSALSLSSTRLDRLSFGKSSERSCLLTVLRIKRKKFIVANTQLACFATNALRYTQLAHIMHTLTKKTVPSIITGDFNVSSLLGRKKLFTLMKKNSYNTVQNRVMTHRLMIIKHQLDYVFGKKCTVQKMSVERIRFSDHYPVIAEVVL